MLKTLGACAATAAVAFGISAAAGFGRPAGFARAGVSEARLVPACPHASYGADGDMSPLFCVVDNPVALKYFKPMGKHLFKLGRNATPGQVAAAIVADRRIAGTVPILCAVYRLAAWREHWMFGVSPAAEAGARLHFYNGWCADPRFNVSR